MKPNQNFRSATFLMYFFIFHQLAVLKVRLYYHLFILNRPPVFANYFKNYAVVKEIMKEMFLVIVGPKNILESQF